MTPYFVWRELPAFQGPSFWGPPCFQGCIFLIFGVQNFHPGCHQLLVNSGEGHQKRCFMGIAGSLLWFIIILIYIYIYAWNQNYSCFDWTLGLLLEGWSPKIEDTQVPGRSSGISKRPLSKILQQIFQKMVKSNLKNFSWLQSPKKRSRIALARCGTSNVGSWSCLCWCQRCRQLSSCWPGKVDFCGSESWNDVNLLVHLNLVRHWSCFLGIINYNVLMSKVIFWYFRKIYGLFLIYSDMKINIYFF